MRGIITSTHKYINIAHTFTTKTKETKRHKRTMKSLYFKNSMSVKKQQDTFSVKDDFERPKRKIE